MTTQCVLFWPDTLFTPVKLHMFAYLLLFTSGLAAGDDVKAPAPAELRGRIHRYLPLRGTTAVPGTRSTTKFSIRIALEY
jgi:hypothetical protein